MVKDTFNVAVAPIVQGFGFTSRGFDKEILRHILGTSHDEDPAVCSEATNLANPFFIRCWLLLLLYMIIQTT